MSLQFQVAYSHTTLSMYIELFPSVVYRNQGVGLLSRKCPAFDQKRLVFCGKEMINPTQVVSGNQGH